VVCPTQHPFTVVEMSAATEVRIVPLVGLVAAEVLVQVQVSCLTWGAARVSTYRSNNSGTWAPEAILSSGDPGKNSLASSQAA